MDKYQTQLAEILNKYKSGEVDLEQSIRDIFGVMSELMGGPV